ncbi:unnamed protein product [Effrenium voratum]|nr:unnamed protein product [Effrenium voratum]|mmetsp:Transcript_19788/g.46731  ORF Transcript_19788/g.46731 Transcript_19788/m.46731 type:complete len:176 (-) Transcript_19788:134-661(-)|eukprot:CAMPEP_0181540064 /NCGR_PEP_ID=MMETSP1110-20121109/76698_1 /TAXON_ID=174948 /ORGANISM="Symbiodinium sp., Strain CCMP421" /LENGTH=175 /DNA_ID=CAMNT_0023671703 /DNA_START=65 /DNA_END=592 /DNA_ORIENTATION=-
MAVILAFLATAAAYPANLNCDFACMGNYMPGSSFGYMNIASIGNVTGTNCVVTTNIPSSGPMANETYTVTVTSTTSLAQKVVASTGDFSSSMVSNTGKGTSQTHSWTASDSSPVTFRVLCGSSQEMWYADTMASTTTTATTTTMGATTTGASTVSTAMSGATAFLPLFAMLALSV